MIITMISDKISILYFFFFLYKLITENAQTICLLVFLYKNLLASIGDNVNATKDDTTIEKDKAIAVSLNKVPEIPLTKINGRKTATRIKKKAATYPDNL